MSPSNVSRGERRRRINHAVDRAARWVITVGGVAIIVSVVLILVLIVKVALPLFRSSSAEARAPFTLPAEVREAPALAMGMDEYLRTVFTIQSNGTVAFMDAATGQLLRQVPVSPPESGATELVAADSFGNLDYSLLWRDGSISLVEVSFEGGNQPGETLQPVVETLASLPPPEGPAPVTALARTLEDGGTVRVDLASDNRPAVTQLITKKDLLGREKTESATQILEDTLPGPITKLALSSNGQTLYAGTSNGYLLRWDLSEPGAAVLQDRFKAFPDERPVTALGLVFGDLSLAVGDGRGGLTTWTPVPSPDEPDKRPLTLLHTLTPHNSPVRSIVPSLRNKSLLSIDENGGVHLDHMTSERNLLALEGLDSVHHVALAARGNGLAALDDTGRVTVWEVENPHPETSLKTLFGKVWYEDYPKPDRVWQSSSGSDDFEPKMSLVPLIFGSFKGTLYAMIYALPLALFGAVYTSQFTTHEFRRVIKPTIEIMAAVPSVVIGFLVALWLAPVVERLLVPFLIVPVLLPVVLVLFVALWYPLRRFSFAKRIEGGYEFLVLVPVIALAALLSYGLAGIVEHTLFRGDFKLWLFQEAGMRYDQRNAIIIAFGLGFAVIPLIFTISEDALSSVPNTLTAGSLALGASRWQTVWRVILPSASPGIFAAAMIGFGRAVGETMIVLMATGNTPLMDWSPFNGMRTLSANIAVEIPEAPVDGTLYRVLFLSAVLLFLLTSILNTAAELVRQHLRKKYGQHA